MKKLFTNFVCALSFVLFSVAHLSAQTIISGIVTDKNSKEKLVGVSISLKGGAGTSTDAGGHFSFKTTRPKPFTLVISYIGYQTIEQQITGSSVNLNFELQQQGF